MWAILMGTSDFAVPCLQALLDAGHEVCGVFAQPNKPKGWGCALTPPPVKELALEHGIPTRQPATLRTPGATALVTSLPPGIIVVVAYGRLLPKEIPQLPLHDCINVHASLLPKYRDAMPIQWAVINGDEMTGVATIQMGEGLDVGDVLLVGETKIGENETSDELFDHLQELGAQALVETLRQLEAGTLRHKLQGSEGASYASMLNRELSVINWSRSTQKVHNLVRGPSPWPVACSVYQGRRIKIYQTQVCEDESGEPGQVPPGKDFPVCCGQNTILKPVTVQYKGGKRMDDSDLLRGHPTLPEVRMEF